MQYSQIWGHVSNRFSATQDGLCKIWVNQGAQAIRRKRQWYWAEAIQTIPLVASQEEYALRGAGRQLDAHVDQGLIVLQLHKVPGVN